MFSQMEKKRKLEMFYLQTLFFQLWKCGILPTQVKPSKKKKENVQKISFTRIICPSSVFFVKNMDFYQKTKTKQIFIFFHLLNWFEKQNVDMITGLTFFVRETEWKKVSDGVKK